MFDTKDTNKTLPAAMLSETRVRTGIVRASYAHVDKPVAAVAGGDEKYSLAVLIAKDDKETLDVIEKGISNAIEQGRDKFGGKIPNKAALKLPLRDGIERNDEAYQDCMFINTNNRTQPQVIDADRHKADPSIIYSGCYCRVTINFYTFNVNGNRGVGASLGNIQFVEDGDPLGGTHYTAESDFGAAEDDDFLA